MGLDISAYSKIKYVRTLRDDEDFDDNFDWRTHFDAWVNEYFSERAGNIKHRGIYSFKENFDFRAGSYSGYGHWRSYLCHLIFGAPERYIFDESRNYKGKPFYELINFSDCEGVLGTKVCKKLAQDFKDHQHLVDKDNAEIWYKSQYANWKIAFELASDGGCVVFH